MTTNFINFGGCPINFTWSQRVRVPAAAGSGILCGYSDTRNALWVWCRCETNQTFGFRDQQNQVRILVLTPLLFYFYSMLFYILFISLFLFIFYFIFHLLNSFSTTFLKSTCQKEKKYLHMEYYFIYNIKETINI